MHGFVSAAKYDARKAIELFKAYWRWWVERHEAHDGRLDIGRRSEVVLAHIHHVINLGIELHVRRQTGPESGTGLGDESHRKLTLEHQNRHSKQRTMGQEAEDERGRDLVRCIGDADIKVGELCLHKVAYDDLEPSLLGPGNLVRANSRDEQRMVNEGPTCPGRAL
jgi:hypothetical protein